MFFSLDYNHPADFGPDETDDYFAQTPAYLNVTRFGATMLNHTEVARQVYGTADDALHTVLEDVRYDDPGRARHAIDGREWQVLIPAANAWFMVAGETLYKLCHDLQAAPAVDKKTFHERWGGKVWCEDRWKLWKMVLEKVARMEDVSGECRELAAQAAGRMSEIETGHSG